jgi:hypothetical protein
MQDVEMKLNPALLCAKAAFNTKKTFHQHIGLKFKVGTSEVLPLKQCLYGAKTWTSEVLPLKQCLYGAKTWTSEVLPLKQCLYGAKTWTLRKVDQK